MTKKIALALTLLAAFACGTALPAQEKRPLILATTTSTQDTGLLDALIPVFEKGSGCFVKTIAVGSGQAMALGRRGEADVLLVHSPEAEDLFVKEGFGLNRRIVMHNDFVVVGPAADAAKIGAAPGASAAFALIAKAGAAFFSRADESGTHALEKKIWKAAEVEPAGEWYRQTGLGMAQTLAVAAEKKGYTLTDRGTYLAHKKNLGLGILLEGDPTLMNVYHVIEVNQEKFPKVNADAARRFADFMVSEDAQRTIAEYGKDQYGAPLFLNKKKKKQGTGNRE
jgi:tungstate transport system substrate-binding protein